MVQKGRSISIPTRMRDGSPGPSGHCLSSYLEMMVQVAAQYPGAPSVLQMRAHQIRFFYEGIRKSLEENTKPRKDPTAEKRKR